MARGQADPELVRQVAVQARAAGMDPLDLLTVIGYETGGTYNPNQPGPRTKWGQHRGLIQFGEPQARDYGVDFNGPVGGQVAAAIKFIQDHGWKPGMGRLEMYAAINAGGATKIHASDAKHGGAPGTVQDKVNYQMGPHEARAKNLLSQYDTDAGPYQPPAGVRTGAHGIPGGIDPADLPWGGGYKVQPLGAPPGGVIGTPGTQTPDPTTTGSTAAPAPAKPYSAAPNSDAARMLSDPTRYGLSPIQAAEMRRQLEAGGPGGGTIGNIPAPAPDQSQTAPARPPAGALSTGSLPASPHREPTPEEREATKQYMAGMGPGPVGIWNPEKIWWQNPETRPVEQPEDPIAALQRLDPEGRTMMAAQPQNQPGQGGQGSAGQLVDDWRNKRPLGLFGGGWT